MSRQLEQELHKAAASTFEDLAFLLPSEKMTDEQAALPIVYRVAVNFKGPFNGRLVLGISEELLPLLAANMLGSDTEPEKNLQLDALKEAANVLCGNLLPAIYGTRVILHLDAPEVLQSAVQEAARAYTVFGLENGRCEAAFYGDWSAA